MKMDIVQNIKDCGQSLIDNAEKIVEGMPAYSRDLYLTCYPTEIDQVGYVNVSYDFIPKDFICRGWEAPKPTDVANRESGVKEK